MDVDVRDTPAPRSPSPDPYSDLEQEPRRKRRRSSSSSVPLFLPAPSDDEDAGSDNMPDAPRRVTTPEAREALGAREVDGLFDDDSGVTFGSAAEPEEDAPAPAPALTPHQIMSSSPANHLSDGDAPAGEKNKDRFPSAHKDTKKIKIKGKGHEASDLNRLLQVYQLWTHRLYPKTPFKDTVDRVEKLCHSKRMHNQLSEWRDKAHGTVNGKRPEELDEHGDVVDLTDRAPESDQADYASSSTHAATRPPSSSEGEDDVGQDDFTEPMPVATINQRGARSPEASAPQPTAHSQPPDEDEDMFDDISEDFVNALDEMDGPIGPGTTPPEEEDEDMWNLANEMQAAS
ncbi:replication fork protection component Swi3-domain-containing protein [Mycena rebaudengoi]|nr:replication fork protection component Swi3-domain-containing protein [Mycena rebaudengoi]